MSPALKAWSWSVVIVVGFCFVFLYKTTTADPGFIPTGWNTHSNSAACSGGSSGNDKSSDRLLDDPPDHHHDHHEHEHEHSGGCSSRHHLIQQYKNLDSPALWAGNWNQLCVSCRIVRPLRAKHCSVTDRCIEVFDHYCPWVGNAIGKGNSHYIVVFLWLALYAHASAAVVGVIQINRHVSGETWTATNLVWLIGFEVLDVFVGISVAALAVAQGSQLARNVTTNELANWHRYKYLQALDGSFQNPFSRGLWGNCKEGFRPLATPMAPVYLPREGGGVGDRGGCKSCC